MSQFFCYVPCFDRQFIIFRLDFVPRYHQGSDEELHKKIARFFFKCTVYIRKRKKILKMRIVKKISKFCESGERRFPRFSREYLVYTGFKVN